MLDRKQFLAALPLLFPATTLAAAAGGNDNALEDFSTLFYRRKEVRQAFERYVAPDYIQHSIGMAQGRDAAIAVLEPMFARQHFSATPTGSLMAGNLGILFLDVRVGTDIRAAVIDIYRWDQGKIVEHWDLKQTLTPEQAANYFDRLHP